MVGRGPSAYQRRRMRGCQRQASKRANKVVVTDPKTGAKVTLPPELTIYDPVFGEYVEALIEAEWGITQVIDGKSDEYYDIEIRFLTPAVRYLEFHQEFRQDWGYEGLTKYLHAPSLDWFERHLVNHADRIPFMDLGKTHPPETDGAWNRALEYPSSLEKELKEAKCPPHLVYDPTFGCDVGFLILDVLMTVQHKDGNWEDITREVAVTSGLYEEILERYRLRDRPPYIKRKYLMAWDSRKWHIDW